MKKLLLVPIFLILWSTVSHAAPVNLAWDAVTDADLAGYRVYQTTVSGQYTFGSGNEVVQIPAGTEVAQVDVPIDETYFWVVTAFDTTGNETGPSNEVMQVDITPPGVPGNFRKL